MLSLRRLCITSQLVLAMGTALPVYADLIITEAMPSNNSGTADWFELSNTGNSVIALSGYRMDDNSFNVANSVTLQGIDSLAPGESVLFVEGNASAVSTFRGVWGSALRVGSYSGSGVGLGSSGDGVVVYNGPSPSGVEQTRQSFGSATTGSSFRWDSNNSSASVSTVGDGHASRSASGDIASPGQISTTSAPAAPVANAATAVTSNGFNASWSASAGATGYILDVSSDNFTSLLKADATSSAGGIVLNNSTLQQSISGLSGSLCVRYRVRAVNSGGLSGYSLERAVPLNGASCSSAPNFVDLDNNLALSGVVGDSHDYYASTGLQFRVADAETADGDLIVSVSSSNPSVVPNANLQASNSAGLITLTIVPTGVGYADLTLTLSDGSNIATHTLKYAASSSVTANAVTRWPSGRSDLSSAIAVDANTLLVADDEPENLVLAYDPSRSGPALKRLAFADFAGALGVGSGDNCVGISGAKCDGESDLEAAVALGSRIYWSGSHSNSKSGKLRPDRWRLVATDVSGSGAAVQLALVGYYQHLRTDLLHWDSTNVHALGANYFALTSSAALDIAPESDNLDGFSIEGISTAPDNSALWLGFRAPLVAAPGQAAVSAGSSAGRSYALIVPVTNYSSLVSANTGGIAGSATFGAPIRLSLGGRAIRELRKTASGEYLILAGPPNSATGSAPRDFRLYSWDGSVDAQGEATNLALRSADLTRLLGGMAASPEGLVEPSGGLQDSSVVGVLSDAGDVDFYADGQAAKELPDAQRKGRLDQIALGSISGGRFSLRVSHNGHGSVSGSGMSCGSSCEVTLDYQSVVTLTASADSGYAFAGWSGACSGTGGCTVTLDAAKTVTAVFGQQLSGANPNGSGTLSALVTGGGNGQWAYTSAGTGALDTAGFIPSAGHPKSPPQALPAGYSFPYGLFDFVLTGGEAGSSATLRLTYPAALPAGTVFWKYGPTADNTDPHWYMFPAAVIAGNQITLTIQDGGLGDDDLVANGTIVAQGGPGMPIAPVPLLPPLGLILLLGLLLGTGLRVSRNL